MIPTKTYVSRPSTRRRRRSAKRHPATALKHESRGIRRYAANALGLRANAIDAGRAAAFDALAAAFSIESDSDTATVLALAIRNTQDSRAVEALIEAAQSDSHVRSMAGTRALMTSEHQVRIHAALEKVVERSGFDDVKKAAANVLASYGDPKEVASILSRMRNLSEACRRRDEDAPEGFQILSRPNDDPVTQRIPEYLTALAAIHHPEKVGLLILATDDADESVRVLATLALGQTQDPRAETLLVQLAACDNERVRRGAETALKQLRASL